jgi:DNA replication and repair protein RecF
MFLEELHIVQYKNYDDLALKLSPKINYFVGNNGEGKTNILDAVYYLAMTKSYFNSNDSQNIRHDDDFFVLQGLFRQPDSDEAIYCAFKKGQKKKIKRNDKEYLKIAEHIGLIPIVMVSPADGILISGASEERRRYMDSVISQFNRNYLYALINYNKALLQRNTWLKDASRYAKTDQTLFDALNNQLIKWGTIIYTERTRFILELEPIFNQYYELISGGKEKVELSYRSQLQENDFNQLLTQTSEKDIRMQHTTVGTHRDDILLNLSEYPIKRIGSQGQQKSFLVALKFAQFDFFHRVHAKRPILLLDDIFDKLDFNRVKNIIHIVAENHFGQIFITDTDMQRAQEVLSELHLDSKIYTIANNQAKANEIP